MLLCVALFGTMTSCSKDNGEYSMPSNDNEIYNLLIGKWQIRAVCATEIIFTGDMELKESGELQMNISYSDHSYSGIGSYALYKRHIDLSIYYLQDCPSFLFDFSGTIYSITEDKMVLVGWADVVPHLNHEAGLEIQCIKVQ